jgi:hypothetical protein
MSRRRFLRKSLASLGGLLLSGGRSASGNSKEILIRGAYSSPGPFWKRGASLDEYGINAIFVHSGSINQGLVRRAHSEGAKVFAEFATFNGDEWLTRSAGDRKTPIDQHGDAWPIDQTGQRSPRQTWFLGVCPTNDAFVQSKLESLKHLVTTLQVDGIWLDYMHWHAQFEDPKPGLPETCFNESCVKRFVEATRTRVMGSKPREWASDILENHDKAWRDWRCSVLADFAHRCREVIREHAPQMLLGNFQCAWRDDEYGGARRKVLGLDLHALSQIFDVMSPMLYHARSGHSVGWVKGNLDWLCKELGLRGDPGERLKIWPIVQAWNDPEGKSVSAEDFEKTLRGGSSAGATGVMMFTLGAVAEDDGKMAVIKKVYGELKAN